KVRVRTPLGEIAPKLYSHDDLLTVNEVFCRKDYVAGQSIRTVVDFGSNIGISALYFLTRNKDARCYLYEPDRRNVARLQDNLVDFTGRYQLFENAVSYESGVLEFGIEATGRYGGIGLDTGDSIPVTCLEVNNVITDILKDSGTIDILKIDTEGVEIATVEALSPTLAKLINHIYLEASPKHKIHPDIFSQTQYGSICRLTNKNFLRR
ncbi:MAG: FkbM family methyltransferase, partial [Gammaproteobacteria bacterium]|nr:FkbM family methyltransferase [Gammaproteobacteria bacterium]